MSLTKKIGIGILISSIAIYFGTYAYFMSIQSERFKSSKLAENYKFEFEENFEEHTFKTKNEGRINSLLFKVEKPKGVICFWKGNGGNLKNWGSEATRYLKKNFDIIITDYREHGKSSGSISFENFHLDAQAVYDFLKTRYFENQIVIVGYSLGTSVASHLAMNNKPSKVILIEPKEKFGDKYLDALFFPLPSIYQSPFRTDLDIPKTKTPISIIVGTKSGLYNDALRLKKLLNKKDSMYVIEGADHQTILSNAKVEEILAILLTN